MEGIASRVPSKRVFWFSAKPLQTDKQGAYRDGDALVRRVDGKTVSFAHVHDLAIGGDHNVMNALAASLGAYFAGVKDEDIHQALKSFEGLPGRQELVAEVEGVTYINDTTATSPEGVIAALKRFGNGGNIVLLAGGSSKGLGFDEMAQVIRQQCKYVILFDGSACDDIAKSIGDGAPMVRVDSMQKAMQAAQAQAKLGDVVLLSPGTSSFGIFKNEFDRGDQFNAAVKVLEKEAAK